MPSEREARFAALKVRRALSRYLRKPNRPVDRELRACLADVAPDAREGVLKSCAELLVESAQKEPHRASVFSRAALSVARAFLAEGLAVVETLPLLIDETTFDLEPWQQAFASLEPAAAERVHAVLSARLAKNTVPQLTTLRSSHQDPAERITELEEQLRSAGTVNVAPIVAPLGRLGASIIEPLRTRIDGLDTDDYAQRRVVLGLRNALAWAIVETLEEDGEVDPSHEPYLRLEPHALFADNLDYAYSFLDGLPPKLFDRASEAWVRRWLAAWRDSPSHHAEQDGIVKRLLPNRRKRLFFE